MIGAGAGRRKRRRESDAEPHSQAEGRAWRPGVKCIMHRPDPSSFRCRKRIEHLFAEAKEQMGLRRARRRGWANVTEQCLLTALAQNLKRIVAALPPRPSASATAVCRALAQLLRWIHALGCSWGGATAIESVP